MDTKIQPLYKITLYDQNCVPISDGVALFFTDNIQNFREKWAAIGLESWRINDETVSRFDRSLAGECVTDYWSDREELNIVQYDKNAEIFAEKQYGLYDVEFEATNAYGFTERYHVKEWYLTVRWVRFQKSFYRIVSYKAKGAKELRLDMEWGPVHLYGNPVIERNKDDLKTICFLTSQKFDTEKDLVGDAASFKIDETIMDELFRDVIGEAG